MAPQVIISASISPVIRTFILRIKEARLLFSPTLPLFTTLLPFSAKYDSLQSPSTKCNNRKISDAFHVNKCYHIFSVRSFRSFLFLICFFCEFYQNLFTDNQRFTFNQQIFKKSITRNTAAIMINSPMNPTGTVLEPGFYQELAKLRIPVISDEIYHGLVYEGKAHSILEYTDQAFVLNGFSKRFAMTGLRLGYLIAPKKYMKGLWKMQQNFLICASSAAQKAGIAALRDLETDGSYCRQMRATYGERRRYMIVRLREIGFGIPKDPQGAFYIFADARMFTRNSLQFAFDILEHAHVGITPGIDFGTGGEGFVRFSYANSLENIKEGLNRVEQYLKARKS